MLAAWKFEAVSFHSALAGFETGKDGYAGQLRRHFPFLNIIDHFCHNNHPLLEVDFPGGRLIESHF